MKDYLVGGAVRELVLSGSTKNAYDLDYVVVGATPQDMLDRGLVQIGSSFPVFMDLNDPSKQYALARTERKVEAGHQGFSVEFDPSVSLEADLVRRDLTCNAIAYDEATGEFIDPFGGVNDIKNGILRHVSDAFKEDPLRALRVVRFYNTKYWAKEIDPQTIKMIHNIVDSGEFDHLSKERIATEIEKIFCDFGDWDRLFKSLQDTNLMDKIFPGLTVPQNISFSEDLSMTWALLFISSSEDTIRSIASNLGFGEKNIAFWISCARMHHGFDGVFHMKSEQVMNIFESIDAFRQYTRAKRAIEVCVLASKYRVSTGITWTELLDAGIDTKVDISNLPVPQIKKAIRDSRKLAIGSLLQEFCSV